MDAEAWQRGGGPFRFQGFTLFSRRGGEGEPLLLIHGFPTSSFDWALIWPALTKSHAVHALDMLGFGLSDKPAGFSYSVRASADQWQAYVQQLGLPEVSVMAHDYGNTVVQELLARQNEGGLPFRIRRVMFLNGGLFPEATFPILMQRLLLGPFGPAIARLSSYRRFAASMKKICVRVPDEAALRAHWHMLQRDGGRLALPKIIQYIRERRTHRARWVGALQEGGIPLSLINGLDDPISGAGIVKRWRELLPDSMVVELPGIGHYPQWEAPEQVLAAWERGRHS
ncbi:MAG TPA: alpha/beta hydrolase [Arenimonas sp.]|nr:alpha/beta hydrolase [Arenimonas sp.]